MIQPSLWVYLNTWLTLTKKIMSIASKSDLNSLSDGVNLDDDAIEEVNSKTIQVTSYNFNCPDHMFI